MASSGDGAAVRRRVTAELTERHTSHLWEIPLKFTASFERCLLLIRLVVTLSLNVRGGVTLYTAIL